MVRFETDISDTAVNSYRVWWESGWGRVLRGGARAGSGITLHAVRCRPTGAANAYAQQLAADRTSTMHGMMR